MEFGMGGERVKFIGIIVEVVINEADAEHELAGNADVGVEGGHASADGDLRGIVKVVTVHLRETHAWIAIVGKTGCGKSTLVRLLLGFEKPEKGSIYYDAKNLSGIDPVSLRKRMGTVIQNGKLFPGTIYENIVITAPNLNEKDAWAAAEIAGIAEDIHEMPMEMDAVIAEGQGGISGGQKQRLMIARAVVNKANILIFDEATSALDNKTQKRISEALDKLSCTRIVIAHRLSTIQNCDRILVMDNGRFVEDGTYDELIKQGGLFAELVERQRIDRGE